MWWRGRLQLRDGLAAAVAAAGVREGTNLYRDLGRVW
jgi:hypothetical protein